MVTATSGVTTSDAQDDGHSGHITTSPQDDRSFGRINTARYPEDTQPAFRTNRKPTHGQDEELRQATHDNDAGMHDGICPSGYRHYASRTHITAAPGIGGRCARP